KVTRDSAEMGEEILWEHFFPFIHDENNYSVLDATTSNPAFERFYSEHLRKQYLRKIFPDARFLLYIRNPFDHVASMIKQDRIWKEIEETDPRQIEII